MLKNALNCSHYCILFIAMTSADSDHIHSSFTVCSIVLSITLLGDCLDALYHIVTFIICRICWFHVLLAYLVYQPKSLIQSCFVRRCWHCWCRCHHHHHLCTPPPGTGLNIETSYLVHIIICTYVPHICTSNI